MCVCLCVQLYVRRPIYGETLGAVQHEKGKGYNREREMGSQDVGAENEVVFFLRRKENEREREREMEKRER